ncbi:HigA family addiction module antitoxin [Fischerella sp. NIES-3754]|uniref:HigA family addiction module antitoxin n=1 Tax=Fischerella sp. NIES-3754 TaxID=1752063 RepID=UPI0007201F12|nr:HigA family addiction module antitoxin [Fischerella sp. NIES-3754]BAU07713.1 plasmid maintenance system antidote protein, XRE family [Fischerella sp. NIES-3754]BCX10058.1 MAG: hypothetical protein KatS3mg066_3917 [Fischerella sp.]
MSQKLTPARVPTPGKFLSRELEARGWTQKDLAEIMGRSVQTINEIIRGSKQITPETAIELSQALGTSAEFWTNLEAKYRLHLVGKEKKEQDIARKSRLYTQKAANCLIEPQAFKAFICGIKKYFSRQAIEEFAYTYRTHPGIILGRLQHDKLVDHKNLRSLLVKVSPHLENWIDN